MTLLIASFAVLAVVCLGLAAQVRSVHLWVLMLGAAGVVTFAARALLARTLAPLAELGAVLARRRQAKLPFLAEAPRFAPFAELAALGIELSAREHEAVSQLTAAGSSVGGDRSTFLRAVSHELRTPLNAILGFTDVLSNELDGPITTDQRENLTIIRASAERLARIVTDMIDVAQLASRDASRSRKLLDVGALLEGVRDAVEVHRGMRPVHVRVEVREGAERMMAEPEGLSRGLRILAEHAIENTDSGEVALLAERVDGVQVLRVQGDGLSPESKELAALLGPPNEGERKQRTTLLRLAIARELLMLQNGRIEVSPLREGEGGAAIVVHVAQDTDEDEAPRAEAVPA
ncbi:MAG TPA: HAMP domain-containing sensor histidine kinase [Polyangiales bacterium]|nr:HAMP domain-containing sensor histidine kinase [Polyangiales bacterium]